MSEHAALIERMAGLLGIASSYADAFGRSVETSTETRQAILEGFGLRFGTEAEARAGPDPGGSRAGDEPAAAWCPSGLLEAHC
jgi:(1->4)-alpha-D-glucan 1-alpha-D-glucosylmutase